MSGGHAPQVAQEIAREAAWGRGPETSLRSKSGGGAARPRLSREIRPTSRVSPEARSAERLLAGRRFRLLVLLAIDRLGEQVDIGDLSTLDRSATIVDHQVAKWACLDHCVVW